MGDIDIGGIPRFGPQSSAGVKLYAEGLVRRGRRLVHSRGRHLLKAGALVERYRDDMSTRPSASASTPSRTSSRSCATGRCASSASRPRATSSRNWRFTLFGAYLQDEFRVTRAPDAERRPALRVRDAARGRQGPRRRRWSTSPSTTPDVGPALPEPRRQPLAARGLRLGRDRRRHDGGARRLRALLQHQQPAEPDRHRHQPAVHAAPGHRQPDLPEARLSSAASHSIRPMQWDIEHPRVHVWNLSLQRRARWRDGR